jgi:polygalacturonase
MKSFIALLAVLSCLTANAGKQTLNVLDFGAKGDGVTKNTAALQKALDACGENGGGTVLVPEGVFLTGSLRLSANTTLLLTPRTDLLGSPDIADYPLENTRWEGEFREGHRALLWATNAANLAISGGTIIGPPLPLSKLRTPRGPVLIELTGCTNTLLENFTSEYQQLWSIHALFCKDLTARNLIIRSVKANGDGMDVDSCDGVLIDRCDINTGDDAISLKSGRGLAAQNLDRPTQNVVIRGCRLQSSGYAALGLGTEMSGGIRHVQIQDCVIAGVQNAIFIKSREGRGGYMEDIVGENLTVLKSPTFVCIDLLKKGIQATDPVTGDLDKWPRVGKISFKNVMVQDVGRLVDAENIPAARPLDGFALTDISGTCGRGISIANATNVEFSQIRVTGFSGPLVDATNTKGTGFGGSAAK